MKVIMNNTHQINRLRLCLLIVMMIFSIGVYADEENCMSCHQYKLFGRMDASGEFHNFYVDEAAFQNSVHGRLSCTACHSDVTNIPHTPQPKAVDCTQACHIEDPFSGTPFSHAPVAEKLSASAHGLNGDDTDDFKPGCKGCHLNPQKIHVESEVFAEIKENCEKCHKPNDLDFAIQHMEFHSGNNDFWTQKRKMLICANCHTNEDMVGDIFKDDMVASFMDTYHGVGFTFGDDRLPVCSDCHDYHSVFASTDVRSTVHPLQVGETCSGAGCHEGASDNFVQGSMHARYSGWQADTLMWLKLIYISLIVGVIGFMLIHNILDYFRVRAELKKHPLPPREEVRFFLRLNKAERISHVIMFMSFTGLAVTGAFLWIPPVNELSWVPDWLFSGELRQWLHRIFAVALTAVSIYHIGYAIFTKRGRTQIMAMMPKVVDAQNIFQNLAYLLHLRNEPPQMPYFNYAEKMEYLAFAWGTIVMTATGLILWLEHLGPKFWVDVARLVHSLEAILAVLAIIVWHFYLVHWRPGKFPMSRAWATGYISEHEVEEEHGLDADKFTEEYDA